MRHSCILFFLAAATATAQTGQLTLQQAIKIASDNNLGLRTASLEVSAKGQLKKTGFDLPKTHVSWMYGQYNSYADTDNNITVTQGIPFTALGSQASLNRTLYASAQLKKAATENELIYQVKQVYYALSFEKARRQFLVQQDTIFQGFMKSATLRHKTGETNLLEKTTAEMQWYELTNQLRLNEGAIVILRTQLQALLNARELPEITEVTLPELVLGSSDSSAVAGNPALAFLRQQIEVAKSQKKVENAKFAPDLLVGFFSQTLIDVINPENGAPATASDRFTGFQVGLALPLWFVPHQARSKAADYTRQAAESSYQFEEAKMSSQFQQAVQRYQKAKSSLEYYKQSALPNSDIILRQVQIAFVNGEIGYAEYLLGVRNAIDIKNAFLSTLSEYNQAIIFIEFLSGNK